MGNHPSGSDPIDSEPETFQIERDVVQLNNIEWTLESLRGVLGPGQARPEAVPGRGEWKTASFEEALVAETSALRLKATWSYRDGLLSDLSVTPLPAADYKAPRGSHIEVRLTPLMATVPDPEGRPGAQLTISVELALGETHDSREFRINGHGGWQEVRQEE